MVLVLISEPQYLKYLVGICRIIILCVFFLSHKSYSLSRRTEFPIVVKQAMKSVVLQKLARFETALESSLSARDIFLTYDADCIDDFTLNALQLAFTRVQRCQYIFFSLLDLSSINCMFPSSRHNCIFSYSPVWP